MFGFTERMRRTSWGVAQSVFGMAEAAAFKTNGIRVAEYQDKPRLFSPYSKQVRTSSSDDERRLKFSRLVYPESAGKEEFEYYFRARERLRQIVPEEDDEGDASLHCPPLDVQSLSEFLDAFPVWKGPSAYICPEVKEHLVQRVQRGQLSGLCYFHAPIVLQHYLVARTVGAHTGMIDIAKFIRGHYTIDELYDYIFENEGGNSALALESILQPGSLVVVIGIRAVDKTQLEQFGPHLLSLFKVHDDFMNGDQLSYRGAPPVRKENPGRHAMVIVGVRTTEDGSKMFLLQNWWANKQFVEMDEAYVEACGGTPFYVKTPQMEIPTKFSIISEMYAETTLDKEDRYPKKREME